MKDTFMITEGKIKTDLEQYADDLRFVLRKGFSDQDVWNAMLIAEAEIEELKEKLRLKKVV